MRSAGVLSQAKPVYLSAFFRIESRRRALLAFRAEFRFWWFPRSMPQMKNFDYASVLVDLVVDQNRAAVACGLAGAFGSHHPSAESGPANQCGPAGNCQNGKLPWRRPRQYGRRFRRDRSAPFACRRDGSPLRQQLAGLFCRHDSASFGVADAFIDRGEGFLVFTIEDRSGLL